MKIHFLDDEEHYNFLVHVGNRFSYYEASSPYYPLGDGKRNQVVDDFRNMVRWTKEECIGRTWVLDTRRICFELEEDVMAFKLRWM